MRSVWTGRFDDAQEPPLALVRRVPSTGARADAPVAPMTGGTPVTRGPSMARGGPDAA